MSQVNGCEDLGRPSWRRLPVLTSLVDPSPRCQPKHLPPFRTFATVYPMANVRNGGTCEVPRVVSTNTDGCVKYRRRRSVFHASIGISAGGGRVRAKCVYREHRGGVAWGGLDTACGPTRPAQGAYPTSSPNLADCQASRAKSCRWAERLCGLLAFHRIL